MSPEVRERTLEGTRGPPQPWTADPIQHRELPFRVHLVWGFPPEEPGLMEAPEGNIAQKPVAPVRLGELFSADVD